MLIIASLLLSYLGYTGPKELFPEDGQSPSDECQLNLSTKSHIQHRDGSTDYSQTHSTPSMAELLRESQASNRESFHSQPRKISQIAEQINLAHVESIEYIDRNKSLLTQPSNLAELGDLPNASGMLQNEKISLIPKITSLRNIQYVTRDGQIITVHLRKEQKSGFRLIRFNLNALEEIRKRLFKVPSLFPANFEPQTVAEWQEVLEASYSIPEYNAKHTTESMMVEGIESHKLGYFGRESFDQIEMVPLTTQNIDIVTFNLLDGKSIVITLRKTKIDNPFVQIIQRAEKKRPRLQSVHRDIKREEISSIEYNKNGRIVRIDPSTLNEGEPLAMPGPLKISKSIVQTVDGTVYTFESLPYEVKRLFNFPSGGASKAAAYWFFGKNPLDSIYPGYDTELAYTNGVFGLGLNNVSRIFKSADDVEIELDKESFEEQLGVNGDIQTLTLIQDDGLFVKVYLKPRLN